MYLAILPPWLGQKPEEASDQEQVQVHDEYLNCLECSLPHLLRDRQS